MNLEKINAIIFDFGGVIIDLNFEKCYKAFKALGFEGITPENIIFHQSDIFKNYEVGAVSEDEFLQSLVEKCHEGTTKEQVKNAWCSILDNIPLERIELIEKLKKKYHLYLLSNSNATHHKLFDAKFMDVRGQDTIGSLFDKAYFSYEIKMSKPASEIYQKVLEENQLNPASTLFIDDSSLNIEGAQAVGIHSVLVERNNPKLNAVFQGYI